MECKQVAAERVCWIPKSRKGKSDVEEREPTKMPLRCPWAWLWLYWAASSEESDWMWSSYAFERVAVNPRLSASYLNRCAFKKFDRVLRVQSLCRDIGQTHHERLSLLDTQRWNWCWSSPCDSISQRAPKQNKTCKIRIMFQVKRG